MKKNLSILSLFVIVFNANIVVGQINDPVHWEFIKEKVSKSEYKLIFNADIDKGWHLYGLNIPDGGPYPTKFYFNDSSLFEFKGKTLSNKKPASKFDDLFNIQIEYFKDKVQFTRRIEVVGSGNAKIQGFVEYMACNDNTCTPPLEKEFAFNFSGEKKSITQNNKAKVIENSIIKQSTIIQNLDTLNTSINDIDQTKENKKEESAQISKIENSNENNKDRTLIGLFLVSMLLGFGALLTPCVYPMIPMTVSYFIRGNKSRTKSIFDAIVFGVSIIVIYTLIGGIVALFKDPEAVSEVNTNWLLNFIFALLFIILATSFFGLFELVLPSGIANKIDQRADKGGFFGPFFVALGMVILSFSCTGPIVAGLLIKASEGEVLEPIVGMFGFSFVFAVPFTLFAIFPSWLKGLPKSGGWLNSVKVFIAFIMLAFSIYFVTKVDQAYHLNLLPRNLYLSIWITIFGLLGFYLLGKIKLPHDSELKSISVPRFLLAIVIFSFTLYMISGLFGSEIKGLDPMLPPKKQVSLKSEINKNLCVTNPKYSDFLHLPHGLAGYFDYDEALDCAKEMHKPVFIDFVGHFCGNCKKMYSKVWSQPEVLNLLKNEFIVVGLYTDDKTKLPKNEWITSERDGKVKNTIGKINMNLQIEKFNTFALPMYAIVDYKGNILTSNPIYTYNTNVDDMMDYLQEGLKNFKKRSL